MMGRRNSLIRSCSGPTSGTTRRTLTSGAMDWYLNAIRNGVNPSLYEARGDARRLSSTTLRVISASEDGSATAVGV